MRRKMDRRIEVMFPVEDPAYREAIINNLLTLYLADNVKAWILKADGSYVKLSPAPGEAPLRSQTSFIEMARLQGIKSIPYDEAIRHDSIKEKGHRPLAKGGRRRKPSGLPSS